MVTIFTHKFVDLDAVCSVWFVRFFVLKREVDIVFVPSNWNGEGAEPEDFILDLHCGIKGDDNGTMSSCFGCLIDKYAEPLVAKALNCLRVYVDAQDLHGSAVEYMLGPSVPDETKAVLHGITISAVLAGFKSRHRGNDLLVLKEMSALLSDLYGVWERRIKYETAAGKVEIVDGVAFCNEQDKGVTLAIFNLGATYVVYQQGNNLGVVRSYKLPELPTINPELQSLIVQAKENWYVDPRGFLVSWGTTTSPAKTKSKVNPDEIVRVMRRFVLHNSQVATA